MIRRVGEKLSIIILRQITRWSGGAVLFGRQAGDALEVFPEEGLCREIQFVGNFLNRQVGVLEHGFGFEDDRFFNPFGSRPAAVLFHPGGKVIGSEV